MTCGVCFLISMFFAPIFASIPPWATGSTLILVGCLMMRQISSINWRYIGDAIPAFVTVMFIPFGYSAAYGLIAGLMVYTALNGMIYLTKIISGGYIVPEDEDHREYWTIKPAGRLPWFITASQSLADRVRGTHTPNSRDAISIRSTESEWKYHDRIGSNGSDRELDSVVIQALPTDPRREKVFKSMGR